MQWNNDDSSAQLQLLLRAKAYKLLQQGASLLLNGADGLDTEQQTLLQAVQSLASAELEPIIQALPSESTLEDESILQIQIEAALNGHELGRFKPVTDTQTGGYQAQCTLCNKTVWTGKSGYIIGIDEMSEPCPTLGTTS